MDTRYDPLGVGTICPLGTIYLPSLRAPSTLWAPPSPCPSAHTAYGYRTPFSRYSSRVWSQDCPLTGLRRLGGIPLRNLAGKICGLLRANKLDCAPRVGKLDGFLGLRVGHLRVGNCGRG